MPDAVDDHIWQRTVAVVAAAHRGDAKAHADEFRRWPAELTLQEQRRMELYLRYLLGYRLHQELRGDCAPEAISAAAKRVQPFTINLVRADVALLTEVLRDALGVPAEEGTVRGVQTDLIASAALGALLTDPAAEMAAMRPALARYYEKHGPALRDLEASG